MGRKFEIVWPDFDISLEMTLFDEVNPELCNTFWDSMPFRTKMAGSMSAGQMMKIQIPAVLPEVAQDKRVLFPAQPPGTLLTLGGNSLLFKWGVVHEPFRLVQVAKINEKDLPKLREAALLIKEAYFFTKVINFATFKRIG